MLYRSTGEKKYKYANILDSDDR